MEEDETITTYNSKIKDLANESFALGERISNEKLVRKVLRTLPKRDTKEDSVILVVNDCLTCTMSDDEGDLIKEELMANYQIIMKWSKLTRAYTAGETERDALMKKNHDLIKNSRALRVYNKRTQVIMESINVKVVDWDISIPEEQDTIPLTVTPTVNGNSDDQTEKAPYVKPIDVDSEIEPAARIQRDHLVDNIIGQIDQGMTMRKNDRVDYRKMLGLLGETCFISKEEPNDVKKILLDEHGINAMQKELIQFDKNDVWELVPQPNDSNVIRTKWIFKNKSDEFGNVTRNKAWLVAQGYTQIEGVDFEETFAPMARLEAIRLVLSIACLLKFKLFQMDVKSAFLNGVVQEEVYIEQPKGFVDVTYPEHVYKLKKVLYGLKQAPRAWYERLAIFLLTNGYTRGGVDNTVFIKRERNQMMVAQIYVDYTVFGGVSKQLVKQFVQQMEAELEMSMVGELKHFLGFQIRQMEDIIFISQANYAKNMAMEFGMETSKSKRIPFATHVKVTKDEDGKVMDVSLDEEVVDSPRKNQVSDDNVVIVCSTTSRKRTRACAAALEKKKTALGLEGDNVDNYVEPSEVVDFKEIERKAEEKKRMKKGKGKAKRPSDGHVSGSTSKKRKGIVISDPKSPTRGDRFVEDDVEETDEEGVTNSLRERSNGKLKVNDSRNRINNRRIVKDVEEVPTDGVDFCSEEHEAKWKYVCARNILPERFLFEVTYNNQTYIDILQDARGYSELGDIIVELTGKALTAWPFKGKLQASSLSLKYLVLHKVSIANLVPTSNNTNVSETVGKVLYVMGSDQHLNIGKVIFDQIVDQSKTSVKLKPIAFPSLICSLLITQHLHVLKKGDDLGEDDNSLTISEKLMKGKHVIDVEFNADDQTEPVPEGEAAEILIKAYEEEQRRLEAEIQAKKVRVSELQAKIQALKTSVPPTINDPPATSSAIPTTTEPVVETAESLSSMVMFLNK
ncbi:transmembrane signal receptor [Lithospermum erythrorhizon]|uniref:Transmembrane signal receptor n=1 Tax=Lithospermum erythrorhizon TaxID=34254 RepID=A0AAV3PBP7_LITER